MTTFPDKRILRKTVNSSFSYADGTKLQVGDQAITMSVSKNIGTRGQATDLFRIHMPTYTSNAGAFSASVNIDGALSNAVSAGVGDPSSNSFKCRFNVVNPHNAQSITVSAVSVVNDSPASTNTAANVINGVQITAVPDNTNNWVTVRAQPLTTGANNAVVTLNANVTFVWNGAYKDTLIAERL